MNVGYFKFQATCILKCGKKSQGQRPSIRASVGCGCGWGGGGIAGAGMGVRGLSLGRGRGRTLVVTAISRQPQDAMVMKVSALNGVKEQPPWSLQRKQSS